MRVTLRRCIRAVLAFLVLAAAGQPFVRSPAAQSTIFRFHADEFWLNLHHFLYVLGRAQMKDSTNVRPAVAGAPAESDRGLEGLSAAERQTWADAISFYFAGPSRKDAVFDEPLPAIARALADAADRPQLPDAIALDPPLRAVLERAAPIYRRAWWPAHRAANLARETDIQALVDRHGRQILAFVTRAYGMEWPADGYPVHLSGYSNWAGAYSTTGHLLVMSSLDPALRGFDALETVFHEGMHQWDDQVQRLLAAQARGAGRRLPPNVSHALIFYTAGEAVGRVAPDHVPYADANGVWQRGFQRFKAPLDEAWKPYLFGTGTRDEAIAALITKLSVP